MKHTKKRAIMSAVAMLVVSAIALSSATFAWFSAGNSVSVNEVQASVSNSDGSILISADQVSWKTNLLLTDLQGVGTNLLPANLVPVSVTLDKSQVIAGSITDQIFKATGTATSGFVRYNAYIKATANCNVTISAIFASSAAFCYGGVVQGSNYKLINSGSRQYYPIDSGTLTATDASADDIINPAEVTSGLGSLQTSAPSPGNITLAMTAGTVYTITVYVWAEGQDAACTGVVTATAATMSLTVTKN